LRKFTLVLVSAGLLLLLLSPAAAFAAQAPTYDQAVDQLVAQGYPQAVEAYLNNLGTSPLGFRFAGSPSDNAAAQYLAQQMRSIGLKNVSLEPVPVDVWDFRGASVDVAGRTLTASTFGGVKGTPAEGLSGPVVYAHDGSAAEFDKLGDVHGKIVVVDFMSDWWWMNLPGSEAALRGAKGIVLTYSPDDPAYYGVAGALGSFDATYDLSFVPMVYVSWADGDWLKAQLIADPSLTATMKSDVRISMADNGGVGYNVVGELPGSVKNGQRIVVASHHDAYFRAGLDDTSAVAAQLTMAKAMKMSGYKPQRTVTFVSTTAEEYGYTNAYYEWVIGSWYAITQAHPDWPGKVAGMLNLEGQGARGGDLHMQVEPALKPLLEADIVAYKTLLGREGGSVETPVGSWSDVWPFTAAGVPSIYFGTTPDSYDATIYHTNYDTADLVDWEYLGRNTKFEFRVAQQLDRGLLPYDLAARADDLKANLSAAGLRAAGADPAAVTRLTTASTAFADAAAAYQARRAQIPSANWAADNAKLMAIEVALNKELTALSVWDDTIYPQQQTMWDLGYLNTAIAALAQPNPQGGKALKALSNVALSWNGEYFSYPVYTQEVSRHLPGYYRLTWGAQGRQALYVDVIPQEWKIKAGDSAGALADLQKVRATEVADLNARLAEMAQVLEGVTPQVASVK